MAKFLGLGMTYNGGMGTNNQFPNRYPDYGEGTGLTKLDHYTSPDSAPVYYKQTGGILTTLTLNFLGLGTLIINNGKLNQSKSPIIKS